RLAQLSAGSGPGPLADRSGMPDHSSSTSGPSRSPTQHEPGTPLPAAARFLIGTFAATLWFGGCVAPPPSRPEVWVADYFDQNGKRRLKTFRTKKDADAFLVEARGEVARGTHTPESTSATLEKAVGLWLEGRCEAEGLEPQTLRTYRVNSRHVVALLGHERLSRLTVPRVEEFRDELLRTRSRGLAGKALTLLKMVLKDAQRRGLVAQNAARDVRIRAQKRHEERGRDPDA
ncbi:MAG TPA: hypothetical protein VFZ01_05960, partial [Geminicoccaceae bacterium]